MKQRVTEIRDKEIRMIKTKSILGALTGLFMWAAPPFATVAVFVLYGMVGHPMDSTSLPQLFTALMLFNNLRIPLMMFPWMLSMFSDAKVSMGRLQEFLMREEIPDDLRSYTSEAGVALRIERAQFQWRTTPKKEKEQSMGGAFGGGVPGGGLGDDGDKPPTVTAICKTDGIGKLCTFFTDRWSRFKKVVVVSFFLLCCAIMLGYRATTDSIEAERYGPLNY